MAFSAKSHPLYSFSCLIVILHFFTFWPKSATASGFASDLIPRDYSPLPPFYIPSTTHFGRLHAAIRRSLNRVNHFKSALAAPKASKIQTQITASEGEYLMKISIGTPPVDVLGIADTGSDLIWTQCDPCKECYNQTITLFDPKNSSTYQNIPCQSTYCNALEKPTCKSGKNTCGYSYSYGDGSFTHGDLATDTLTLGAKQPAGLSLPKLVFGCGHDNGGTFNSEGSGIIGLGGGRLSLISQVGQYIGKRFSYCLVFPTSEANISSKITIGSDSVTGPGAVTTPLMEKNPDTFYYLTLEAISVGNKKIPFEGSSSIAPNAQEGNIIIDSGTTLTFLPSLFLDDLVSTLEKTIRAERVDDPTGVLSLCYKTGRGNVNFPVMTVHFKGADVKLQPTNTFALVQDGVSCLTMMPSDDACIYGNLAQMNFQVGYDLEGRTVSFLPNDCSNYSMLHEIM